MLLPLDEHWSDEIWQSPYRLRFELNTGGSYVNMFTSAYERARQLARTALQIDRPLAIVVARASPYWIITAREGETTSANGFERLQEMGVSTDQAEAAWEGPFNQPIEGDEEHSLHQHRAIRVGWDEADILLWNNIAQDIGVEPRAPVLSKLADPENGIVVNAYDDRGMDITALSAEPIQHLYRRFDTWLLDYDRPRMAEVFGPRASGC